MFPAFFLGLSPAILRLHFALDGGLVAGFTAFLGPFAAAVSSFTFNRHPARQATIIGTSLMLTGVIVVLIGVNQTWLAAVWIGAVLGGTGFGASFGGQIRLIAPHIQPHQRAGVFSGIYTVAYLTFGLPVIIAGQLVPILGPVPTFQWYAAATVAFAVPAVVIQLVRHGAIPQAPSPRQPPPPEKATPKNNHHTTGASVNPTHPSSTTAIQAPPVACRVEAVVIPSPTSPGPRASTRRWAGESMQTSTTAMGTA
jgi:MFS family permease